MDAPELHSGVDWLGLCNDVVDNGGNKRRIALGKNNAKKLVTKSNRKGSSRGFRGDIYYSSRTAMDILGGVYDVIII